MQISGAGWAGADANPPKIVIKSVNSECPTYERNTEEGNIVGRVIWAAKWL
jgi:hypothetical protein